MKIDRSADALRGSHNPAFFPSDKNAATNRIGNHANKNAASGLTTCPGGPSRQKNNPALTRSVFL
jgi:hypothetical protein